MGVAEDPVFCALLVNGSVRRLESGVELCSESQGMFDVSEKYISVFLSFSALKQSEDWSSSVNEIHLLINPSLYWIAIGLPIIIIGDFDPFTKPSNEQDIGLVICQEIPILPSLIFISTMFHSNT